MDYRNHLLIHPIRGSLFSYMTFHLVSLSKVPIIGGILSPNLYQWVGNQMLFMFQVACESLGTLPVTNCRRQ
jgi:hypothetical protein